MATIVNQPAPAHEHSGSGMGFLLGIILLVILGVLLFTYGIPYLSNSFSGPQVNVPGQVDVNVNTPQK
jgi:hypothetical protein